jgi:ketosteroid isomerase-like protein
VNNERAIEVVLESFDAVERRDERRQRELFHPKAEFVWPPSLQPRQSSGRPRPTWEELWDPLQPTEAERRLDPRVVAASEDEVVVLWQQRGRDSEGNRFECPVLGLYHVREGKLARGQMFYFDTTATAGFLARAHTGFAQDGS